MAEVMMGIALLGMAAVVLVVGITRERQAAMKLSDTREAGRVAEAVLSNLQAHLPPPRPSSDIQIIVNPVPDSATINSSRGREDATSWMGGRASPGNGVRWRIRPNGYVVTRVDKLFWQSSLNEIAGSALGRVIRPREPASSIYCAEGMESESEPFRLYDIGPFAVLSKRPNPDGLTVVTYPLFELVLPHIEHGAGRKFTAAEVEAELAKAPSVALPKAEAEKFVAAPRRPGARPLAPG